MVPDRYGLALVGAQLAAAAGVFWPGEPRWRLPRASRSAPPPQWSAATFWPRLGRSGLVLAFSVTKGMTATAVAVAHARGLLDSDAPVGAYWPEDRPRSGRPRQVSTAEIVVRTLEGPPAELGVTHWSSRLLAKELGIGNATVARAWRDWDIQPWRVESFKFSTDPQLEAKVHDVVGLYLNPPENAIVLCIDERSQIQALDRTAPVLPVLPGVPEKQTHDYVRNGTTTLFAALEVATGKVVDACLPRHRHQEFLRFLKQVATAHPRRTLHIVCDNYGTHKHPKVKAWLARNKRVTLYFTPTSGSWLNMVEIFFGIITHQAIRRGTFTSVPDLIAAIRRFIDSWNDRCEPLLWTKPADQILAKAAKRKVTSETRH